MNNEFIFRGRRAGPGLEHAGSDVATRREPVGDAAHNRGEGQEFRGKLERDESTNIVAVQVSAPVLDRGKTIGVLVVGVTISYLQTKRQ